jgi:hypothetical protein
MVNNEVPGSNTSMKTPSSLMVLVPVLCPPSPMPRQNYHQAKNASQFSLLSNATYKFTSTEGFVK